MRKTAKESTATGRRHLACKPTDFLGGAGVGFLSTLLSRTAIARLADFWAFLDSASLFVVVIAAFQKARRANLLNRHRCR